MKKETIIILCSGVALGVYIPGLIVNYQLKEMGYYTEVVVLESLLLKGKQQNIPNTKLAFHRDFSVALMGQKLAGTIVPSIDADLVSALLTTWKYEILGGTHGNLFVSPQVEILGKQLKQCLEKAQASHD